MPKFDFKPGDEAYIVPKDRYRVEGPYRVASIRRGSSIGPQALILEGGSEPIAHTDPETAFHDRDAARLFAISLVDKAIYEAKKGLESLEKERFLLLKDPKYRVGQTVWLFSRYSNKCERGPFVVEEVIPHEKSVLYRLNMDDFFQQPKDECDLYPTKDEARAVAIEQAAKRVAEAQKELDKAKAEEKEVING